MAVLVQDLPIGALFAHFADFVFYAHYQSHTEATLESMEESLQAFRKEVSDHLYEFNVTNFTTPKYHILSHYVMMVRRFGSLLNGDTEVPERLHCGVKIAYRRTNKKGEWLSQLARNLDEFFLVEQLYLKTENKKKIPQCIHGTPGGRVSRPRAFKKEFDANVEVIYLECSF
jgi:hypothetical protein